MSEHQGSPGKASLEELKKHLPHRYKQPRIDPSCFIAPGVQIIGDVEIGKDSSVWFNCVLRADVNFIRIGERTNIQDLTLVHESYQTFPTIVGNDVTVGHSVILHATKVGNFSLIGMGSCLLDGSEIGDFVLLGAGSLVTEGMKIPSYSKAFGRPAKVVGKLSDEEIERLKWSAKHYVQLAETYLK